MQAAVRLYPPSDHEASTNSHGNEAPYSRAGAGAGAGAEAGAADQHTTQGNTLTAADIEKQLAAKAAYTTEEAAREVQATLAPAEVVASCKRDAARMLLADFVAKLHGGQ